ncbi:MAG TPA: DUF5675 family protein [Gemmatimonadales bacterium]|nr:DUF5675 family protein [Gemmatimonadales bacterium]
MRPLMLTRKENTEDGVFGVLAVPGAPMLLHTCEDDWTQNRRGLSCIPAGTYPLQRTIYHRHGYETFEVTAVPGRSRILIHPGNTENDVQGCIAVGMRRGTLTVPDEDRPGKPVVRKRAVVASQEAFRRFMEWMRAVDLAELEVRWESPEVEAGGGGTVSA